MCIRDRLKIDSKCGKINDKFEKINEKFETITDKILESVNNMFSTQIDSVESRMIKVDEAIVENEVFKSDIMKINSDDDNIETVGVSKREMRVGGCKGAETSVYKLEENSGESK